MASIPRIPSLEGGGGGVKKGTNKPIFPTGMQLEEYLLSVVPIVGIHPIHHPSLVVTTISPEALYKLQIQNHQTAIAIEILASKYYTVMGVSSTEISE